MKNVLMVSVFILGIAFPARAEKVIEVGFGTTDVGHLTGNTNQASIDIALDIDIKKHWGMTFGIRKEGFGHSDGVFFDLGVSWGKSLPKKLTGTIGAGLTHGIVSSSYGGFAWKTDDGGKLLHQRWRFVQQNGSFPFVGPDNILEGPTVTYPFLTVGVSRPLSNRFFILAEARAGFVRAGVKESAFSPAEGRMLILEDSKHLAILPVYRIAVGFRF